MALDFREFGEFWGVGVPVFGSLWVPTFWGVCECQCLGVLVVWGHCFGDFGALVSEGLWVPAFWGVSIWECRCLGVPVFEVTEILGMSET